MQEAAQERAQGIQDFDEVLDEMRAQASDFERQLAAKRAACDRQHAAMDKAHDCELQKLHVQRGALQTQVEDLRFQVASLTEHGGEDAGAVRMQTHWISAARVNAQPAVYTFDITSSRPSWLMLTDSARFLPTQTGLRRGNRHQAR